MVKPPPFLIAIDTREQRPLDFDGFETVRRKLDAGDYGLQLPDGSLGSVAVERKSHSDFWGSMSTGRARFERCVQRLAKLDRAAIVIECSLTSLCISPAQVKQVSAASTIGGIISWSVQYGLPVWFADNRVLAARIVLRVLASWYKHRSGLYVAR